MARQTDRPLREGFLERMNKHGAAPVFRDRCTLEPITNKPKSGPYHNLGYCRVLRSTIILVDRIGEGSRISEMAKKINGDIVQMSMTHWTKEVAEILKEKIGFKHPILDLSNSQSLTYIKEEMKKVNLREFM